MFHQKVFKSFQHMAELGQGSVMNENRIMSNKFIAMEVIIDIIAQLLFLYSFLVDLVDDQKCSF